MRAACRCWARCKGLTTAAALSAIRSSEPSRTF
jgi:hypothetical protein